MASKQPVAGSSPAGRAKTASELGKYLGPRSADRWLMLRQPATSADMRTPGNGALTTETFPARSCLPAWPPSSGPSPANQAAESNTCGRRPEAEFHGEHAGGELAGPAAARTTMTGSRASSACPPAHAAIQRLGYQAGPGLRRPGARSRDRPRRAGGGPPGARRPATSQRRARATAMNSIPASDQVRQLVGTSGSSQAASFRCRLVGTLAGRAGLRLACGAGRVLAWRANGTTGQALRNADPAGRQLPAAQRGSGCVRPHRGRNRNRALSLLAVSDHQSAGYVGQCASWRWPPGHRNGDRDLLRWRYGTVPAAMLLHVSIVMCFEGNTNTRSIANFHFKRAKFLVL
jgi:hypothetical protein